MSTLRGWVYRLPLGRKPWVAEVDEEAENGDYRFNVIEVGHYRTQPEALAAVCQRLKDEAAVEDIVRRAEGKEAGA